MFESGKWIVAPYKEKKLHESYIVSVHNTDSIVELNSTAHTILNIIKSEEGSTIGIFEIITKMKEMFDLTSVDNNELETDVEEILQLFVNGRLIYLSKN